MKGSVKLATDRDKRRDRNLSSLYPFFLMVPMSTPNSICRQTHLYPCWVKVEEWKKQTKTNVLPFPTQTYPIHSTHHFVYTVPCIHTCVLSWFWDMSVVQVSLHWIPLLSIPVDTPCPSSLRSLLPLPPSLFPFDRPKSSFFREQ